MKQIAFTRSILVAYHFKRSCKAKPVEGEVGKRAYPGFDNLPALAGQAILTTISIFIQIDTIKVFS